jgi:hypothetical protein
VQDAFTGSLDMDLWSILAANGASGMQTNGRAQMRLPNVQALRYAQYISNSAYSLAGCALRLEVLRVISTTNADPTVFFRLYDAADTTHFIEIAQKGGELTFSRIAAGLLTSASAPLPYDPEAHRHWAFSESAGSTSWLTSPDGAAWTTRFAETSPAYVGAMRVGFGAAAELSGADLPGIAAFDNLH